MINWYTLKGGYLKLSYAVLLIILSVSTGVLGYVYIEGYTFQQALYMTIITISTVGFSEVNPLSESGQLFTTILIVANFGVVAYTVSAFTAFIIEGTLFKGIHQRTIQRNLKQMKDHIIVCGYGRYGREIVDHLLKQKIPFVLIEKNPDIVEEIQKMESKIIYVEGDVTHDEVLEAAGVDRASALISTLPDDTDNLFTILSARQMNSKINLISAAKNQRTEKKLRQAGADHVIMPDRLGGFYMSTLISKPGAVEFFSFITNNAQSDIGFEELSYDNLAVSDRNKSIIELGIREKTGTNVIGIKKQNGHFEVNPKPDARLEPGDSFIVIGSRSQLKELSGIMKKQS